MRSALFALTVFVALGCKGNPEKCEKACRNYHELTFWERADAEIAAAPGEKRDELRKAKMAQLSNDLVNGIDMCSSKCMSANNDTQTDCLIAAKTAQQVKACVTEQ